jgi:hypothetical protein
MTVAWSASMAALAMTPAAWARRMPWVVLATWIAAVTVLEAPLRSLAPHSLESLYVSNGANGFHSVAVEHDAARILRQFGRIRANGPLHVQSNMPGKLLLADALLAITSATTWLPWLLVGLSHLGAILMFVFVRDVFKDPQVGLAAALLYLVVPARHYFFPLMNTVTPLVILACACVLVRWLQTGRVFYAAMMGVAIFGLIFFEPLPLVMGLLFLALALSAIVSRRMLWSTFVGHLGIGMLAFVATAEVVTLATGFNPLYAFRAIAAHAVEFNAAVGRSYSTWVVANLGEFVVGAGICQVTAAIVVLVSGLRMFTDWRGRVSHPPTVVALGLVGVLAATDLIGINRGEVLRLWIFLACFYQIPAAYLCATLGTRGLAVVVFVTALQAAIGVAMVGFVLP